MWWILLLTVVAFALVPILFESYLHSIGKQRKLLPRYHYEEELLATQEISHEEEFVPAPGRNGHQLYRQLWRHKSGTKLKGMIIFVHGLNSYSGRFAKEVLVIPVSLQIDF